MARKVLKDTAKLLGGLGTAYLLSEALGPRVELKDVNQEDAARDAEKRAAETKKHLIAEAGMPLPKKKGGVVSASKRADGMAQRGKTRGKMV